ncbi:MAG: asparagine synthase-related protein [Phycisphaerales bacterium]
MDVALVHRRLLDHRRHRRAQPMVIGTPSERSRKRVPPASRQQRPHPHCSPPKRPLPTLRHPHTCPACDASGTGVTAVVFNGCIYNHRDLRRELEAAGHEFHTDHSDTEVLLHAWRAWGPGLIDRLDGMYAAAVWDEPRARVLLLRDRFGEKPLYLSCPSADGRAHPTDAALMGWSSSFAGLARWRCSLGLPALSDATGSMKGWTKFGWNQVGPTHEPSPVIIGRCQPLPEVRDVPARPLGPTCTIAPHDSLAADSRLWGEALATPEDNPTVDQVDRCLRAAVQSRLEADVPLGCFLSGGIDSALIARYASEARPDLGAFTVRMPLASMDESEAAAATARHLGVRHDVLDCQPHPAQDLVSLIESLGLPFGDSSLLPTTWVSRAARAHVTVALSGDGGDELFLGYDRHRAIPLLIRADAAPALVARLAARVAKGDRNPRSRSSRAARLLGAINGQGYKELVAIFPRPMDSELGVECNSPFDHFGMTYRGDAESTRRWALRFDRLFYLPEDILRKTDTASMSVALEVRAPFLANDVASLAFGASPAALMPRGQRKGLLKAVARKYLPDQIVDRPKQGFAIPISDWFRTDYGGMRQLLLDHLTAPDPFPGLADAGVHLNMAFVRRMLKEHDDAGEKSLWPWKGRDHGQRLYMLLVLSIWCRWLQRVQTGQ